MHWRQRNAIFWQRKSSPLVLQLCILIKLLFTLHIHKIHISNYIDSQVHCAHLWSYFAYKTVLALLIYHHLHWFNNRFLGWFSSHILKVAWPKRSVVTEKLANVLRHLTKEDMNKKNIYIIYIYIYIYIKKKKRTAESREEWPVVYHKTCSLCHLWNHWLNGTSVKL